MMHRSTNCPGTNVLRKFLEEELSDNDPDFQFHYSQWQTTDRVSLVIVISTCEECKDNLISAINVITKHLLLAKCQANFLRAKKEPLKADEVRISLKIISFFGKIKPKVTIGVKNTAHYTHSLYIILTVIEISNTILFVSSLMITTTIQILFVKYKQSLLINLKKTFQLWIRSSISLTPVLNNIRITKALLICVMISKISIWMLNEYSLQLVMAGHHAMVLGDLLNVM